VTSTLAPLAVAICTTLVRSTVEIIEASSMTTN
jgi:hypothetical protein